MFGSLARSRLGPAALTGAVVAMAAAPVVAAEPAVQGVLVLRNGNVLTGAVRPGGDYYRVESAGASLQVPASQVEMACRDLDEAYEMRRSARAGTTADSHIELARWCLRQNLLDQAVRELVDARTLDPSHPALAPLELQLEQIIQLKADGRAASHKPPRIAAAARRPTSASAVATPSEFDLSLEARTGFVRSIQPMLIHMCATAGCHQPGGAQQLQLDRWALTGNGNATLVRRNLAAVVQQIRQDDPESSPLLALARQEHGGASGKPSVPLAPLQATMLVEWINAAAGVKPTESVETEAPSDPASTADDADQPAPKRASSLPSPPSAVAPSQPAPFVPRDAFDPEIFNRRVASQAAATEPAAASAASSPAQE